MTGSFPLDERTAEGRRARGRPEVGAAGLSRSEARVRTTVHPAPLPERRKGRRAPFQEVASGSIRCGLFACSCRTLDRRATAGHLC